MLINNKSRGIFTPNDMLNFGMNKGHSLKELYLYLPSYLEWLILNVEGLTIDIQEFYALGKPKPFDKYFIKYSEEESEGVLNKLETEVKNLDSTDKIYDLISVAATCMINSEENIRRINRLLDKYEFEKFIDNAKLIFTYSSVKNLSHPNSCGLFSVSGVYGNLKIGKNIGIKLHEVDYVFPKEVIEKNESKFSFLTS